MSKDAGVGVQGSGLRFRVQDLGFRIGLVFIMLTAVSKFPNTADQRCWRTTTDVSDQICFGFGVATTDVSSQSCF